jgi:type I restriction enzyme S subunit
VSEEWPTYRLAELTTKIGSGATPRGGAESYKATGVPLIRSLNVHFDGVRDEGLAFLDDNQARELDSVTVQHGDVLLNITGASIGRVALAPSRLAGARVNQHVAILRPMPQIDGGFLAAFFASPAQQALIFEEESGATRQALTKAKLEDWTVPAPPIDEQRRIVAKLDALRARSRRAKDALDAVPALLDRLRQSILAAAFRGDLTAEWRAQNPDVEPATELLKRIRVERRKRWEEAELAKLVAKGKAPKDDRWKAKYVEPEPVDESELPELPEGWCWTSLHCVAPLQPGYAFSSKSFTSSGTRLLKGSNVRDGWLSAEEVDFLAAEEANAFRSYELRCGDIVLAMDRPVYSSGTRAAKVAMLDVEWEGSLLLQRVGRFRRATDLDTTYLYAFLRSGYFRDHLVRGQKGSQDGRDLPHVSAATVDATVLPLAPVSEQMTIARLLTMSEERLQNTCGSHARTTAQLARLDIQVLAAGFRGELVDRQSDAPPSDP